MSKCQTQTNQIAGRTQQPAHKKCFFGGTRHIRNNIWYRAFPSSTVLSQTVHYLPTMCVHPSFQYISAFNVRHLQLQKKMTILGKPTCGHTANLTFRPTHCQISEFLRQHSRTYSYAPLLHNLQHTHCY